VFCNKPPHKAELTICVCFFNGFRESEKQQQILVSNLVSMKFELLVLVLCFLVSILWSKFLVGFFLFDGHGEERDAFLRCGIVCVAESN